MNIQQNTILITGGATGLGLALAEQFLINNNTVIICGRRKDKLEEAKLQFPLLHTRVCDVSKKEERIALIDWLFKNFQQTNVFINNAGIQNYMSLTKAINLDEVTNEIETNFTAPIHFANLLLPHFLGKQNSYIINITSGLAFSPLALVPVYCATKAALHSFTLSLRHQLKPTGIQVIEVAPPIVDTNLGGSGRNDNNITHRGITVNEFALETIIALQTNEVEIAVGQASNIRLKREEMFPLMNR
ncbi:MAG: SDR family NAD(P)-dependent oxidoreductase [Bacteroidota bacterium]